MASTYVNKLISFSWIGPLIFVVSVIIFGFLNPQYSHISQFISELGADGSRGFIFMNWLGIVPFGISIGLFSVGGFFFYKNVLAKVSFTLLLIVGLLFICAGVFNCDQECAFANMSQKAIVHNISAFSAFMISIIVQLLLGFMAFSKNPNPTFVYSLTAAVLGTILFYLMMKAGINSDFRGLFQRFFLANFLFWMVLVGREIRLVLKTDRSNQKN